MKIPKRTLISVSHTLEKYGWSLAHGVIGGQDIYQVLKVPVVQKAPRPPKRVVTLAPCAVCGVGGGVQRDVAVCPYPTGPEGMTATERTFMRCRFVAAPDHETGTP